MFLARGTHLVFLLVAVALVQHSIGQSSTNSTQCGRLHFNSPVSVNATQCDLVCQSNQNTSLQCPSLNDLCRPQNACTFTVSSAATQHPPTISTTRPTSTPTTTTRYPDECSLGTHQCHTDANCTDFSSLYFRKFWLRYTCTCKSGYSGDGRSTCTDIDECAAIPCKPGSTSACRNSPGSYSCYYKNVADCDRQPCSGLPRSSCFGKTNGPSILCLCDAGFAAILTDNGATERCENINECLAAPPTAHTCGTHSTCTDIMGSYTCPCDAGYTNSSASQNTCADENECVTGSHRCHRQALCENTNGGYTCSCLNGYTGDGNTCVDVNECLQVPQALPACRHPTTCRNVEGSYLCDCLPGYTGSAPNSCTDVDECMTSLHDCQANANCTNSQGDYSCQCGLGYTGNGRVCSNVDECAPMATTECHRDAVCVDTVGSFVCVCKADFHGTGKACKAVSQSQTQSWTTAAFAVVTSILVTMAVVAAILFLYRRRQQGKYALGSPADESATMVMNELAPAATTYAAGDTPDADVILDHEPETIEYLDVDKDDRHEAIENDYGFGEGEAAEPPAACDQEYVLMKKAMSSVDAAAMQHKVSYQNVPSAESKEMTGTAASTSAAYWDVVRDEGEVSVAIHEANLTGMHTQGRVSIRRTQSFDKQYQNHGSHAAATAPENKGAGGARPFLVRLPSLDPATAADMPFKVPFKPSPSRASDNASRDITPNVKQVIDGGRDAAPARRVTRSSSARLPMSNAHSCSADRSAQKAGTARPREVLTSNPAYGNVAEPVPQPANCDLTSASDEIQVSFPLGEFLPNKDKLSTFSWDAKGEKRMEIISDQSPRGSIHEVVKLKKRA